MLKRFPHLTTIAFSYVAALLLFFFLGEQFFHNLLTPFGIAGVFIAGALYTYSFSSAAGAVLLLALAPYYSPGVIAVVGGLGAVAADLTIFRFITHDLKKEVGRIAKSALVCQIGAKAIFCKQWFRNALGFMILASPAPDELGIAMISTTKISKETFVVLMFIADMVGIYLLVSLVAPLL